MEEVLGIRLKYYFDEKLPVYLDKKKGQHACHVVFTIEKGIHGEEFVSTSEIREAIEKLMKKHSLKIGTEMGYFLLDLYSKNKKVAWNEYWPFQIDRKSLEKKGIAGTLEEKVYDKIEGKFFVPEIVRHRAFGFRRWKQLRNRGVKVPKIPGWPFSSSYQEERKALKSGEREKPTKKKGFARRLRF